MDLNAARQLLVRTHVQASRHGARANAIELRSGPGLGKSETVVAACSSLAAELGEPVGLVTFMLATVSSVDVRGFMIPTKTEGKLDSVFSTPPWFPKASNMRVCMPDGTILPRGAWQAGVPAHGVLFLDEWGQADDDIKKAAAELLLNGEVGDTELPKGWRVVAASNRMMDRSGVMRELLFVVNRRCLASIDPSLPAWLNWGNSQPDHLRPNHLTMSFAQKNPDIVFKDAVPEGADPFCTPRSLVLMDRDLRALASAEDERAGRMPLDPLAREVAAGWIGAASAAQYFVHMKYADEIPEMHQVERDPMTAKLPPNADAQMVVSYMLAHNVEKKNTGQVMKYVGRLLTPMQVLFVRAAQANKGAALALTSDAVFGQWLIKNKRLLIESGS